MKILFDARACQTGSELGGIGRYTESIIKAIILERPHDEHHLIVSDGLMFDPSHIKLKFSSYIDPCNFHLFTPPIKAVFHPITREDLVSDAEKFFQEFVRIICPDVFFVASLVEGVNAPFICRAVPGIFSVAVLYDLIPWNYPDKYLLDPQVENHYRRSVRKFEEFDHLLSISDFSKREYFTTFPDSRVSITNISSGVSEFFENAQPSQRSINRLKEIYGIRPDKKILLYVSSFDLRKNHRALALAYGIVDEMIRDSTQLVVVGNGSDAIYSDICRDLDQKTREKIVFTGKISDSDLLCLYNMSYLLVFPSLYEGFGLPILEANKCHLPAICSKSTSLIEAVGSAEALFDPLSIEDIASRIDFYLRNEIAYKHLKDFAIKHVQSFTWRSSAKKAIEVIEHGQGKYSSINEYTPLETFLGLRGFILQSRLETSFAYFNELLGSSLSLIRASLYRKASTLSLSWAIVSSYNTKCGIASYTKYFANSLRDAGDNIYIFSNSISSSEEESPELEANVQRCFDFGSDDLKALQIQLLRTGANIVYIAYQDVFYNSHSLLRLIESLSDSGIYVVIEMHKVKSSMAALPNTLVRALAACSVVIAHSESALNELKEHAIKDNVLYLPLGIDEHLAMVGAEASSHDEPAEETHSDRIVMATFGFLVPHKGIYQLLEAYSELADEFDYLDFHIYSSLHPSAPEGSELKAAISSFISEKGLHARIVFNTTYLDDVEVVKRLASADFCVLNYKETNESASASLRHVAAAGIPLVLPRIPIFMEAEHETFYDPSDSQSLKDAIRKYVYASRRSSESGSFFSKPIVLRKMWARTRKYLNYRVAVLNALIRDGKPSAVKAFSPVMDGTFAACARLVPYSQEHSPLFTADLDRVDSWPYTFGPYAALQPGSFFIYIFGTSVEPLAKCDILLENDSKPLDFEIEPSATSPLFGARSCDSKLLGLFKFASDTEVKALEVKLINPKRISLLDFVLISPEAVPDRQIYWYYALANRNLNSLLSLWRQASKEEGRSSLPLRILSFLDEHNHISCFDSGIYASMGSTTPIEFLTQLTLLASMPFGSASGHLHSLSLR